MKNLSRIPRMKRMFAAVLLLVMGFTSSESVSQCVTPPSGLVSWWPGDGNADDIQDINHGALQNGATFASGLVGQAFSFDGVDGFVEIPHSMSLNPTNALSLEAWIYINQYTFIPAIVSKGNGGNYVESYSLTVTDEGSLQLALNRDGTGGGRTSILGPIIPLNTWAHVAGTYDGTIMRIYLNGAEVGSANHAGGIFITPHPVVIGKNDRDPNPFGYPTSYFNGLIDDVAIFDRALFASEIQSIYNAGSAGKCANTPPPVCVNPPSGLVSWWPGDGNANDIQSGNNGTLINDATFAAGLIDQAFSFDGVDDYVTIASSANLTLTSAVSVELWFNASSQAADQMLASRVAGAGEGWQLDYTANGGMNFWIGTGGIWARASTSSPSANIWHHIAGTWDGSTIRLYVDGIEVNSVTKTGTTSASATEIVIGTYNADPLVFPFGGLIDETSIYNRALSAAEIQSIYNAGSAGKCANTPPPVCVNPPSGLVSWWPGDGNANDIQSGNNGTLINDATFATGLVDQAFSFDGAGDYVSVPDNTAWDFGMNDFTIDLWIRFNQVKSSLFIHQQHDFGGGFEFLYEAGTVAFNRNGFNNAISRAWTPQANTWHHLAVTRTSGTFRLYANGTQLGSEQYDSNPVSDVSGILRIGNYAGTDAYDVNGLIDEVSIYHSALSAAEIQSLYNAGSAGKCKECTPPEVSITGDDPVFTGTTHTYTVTTGANNPSFEWSVAGGTINGGNTNSSVSITAGAAGTMMVSVNVTDGVTDCSKEETKEVTVNPLPAGSNEVVFATNSVWLKEHAKILSGNVIVNNASSGPVLDSQVELSVGQGVATPAGFALKAHRMKVKQGAVVASDIFYNELSNNGTISGSQNSPLTLPVFASLPPFHQASAGTQDVTVNPNGSITLTAGAYRDLLIKQNGTIIFNGGGTFAIRSLNTGAKAKLLFDSPTEILITGKLDTDENSYVGPQSGSGLGAADIVFYIAGSNGNNGNFGATPKAAQLGLKNTVLANFYVPNGTLWLRQGTVATGAFLGRDVIVGEQVQVALESAFGGGSLAKFANNEGDEEKLTSTAIPEAFALLQNYPNPFNPTTVISFQLPEDSEVSLAIYNLSGQLVKQVASGEFARGTHSVVWDATDETGMRVASGVYVYVLRAGEFVAQRKLVLMK